MTTDLLVVRLFRLFQQFGYSWKINGEDTVPSEDDLKKALDRAKELLYDEPVPSQLEVGRLIVRRWADHKFDVYLQLGTYND
jgi:hypothetical protein